MSGVVALGTSMVWLFGIKPSPSLVAPVVAIAASLACATLFFFGKRIENKLPAKLVSKAEKPLPQYPIPNLRMKVLEKCVELQALMGRYPENVTAKQLIRESVEQYLARISAPDLTEQRIRFTSEYRLHHEQSVIQLRDEIGVRCGISDPALNEAIGTCGKGPEAATALDQVIQRFWCLALNINC